MWRPRKALPRESRAPTDKQLCATVYQWVNARLFERLSRQADFGR